MNERMIVCTSCGTETSYLAIFPGDLCLECYKLTPEANAPLTEQGLRDLTKLWGGR